MAVLRPILRSVLQPLLNSLMDRYGSGVPVGARKTEDRTVRKTEDGTIRKAET